MSITRVTSSPRKSTSSSKSYYSIPPRPLAQKPVHVPESSKSSGFMSSMMQGVGLGAGSSIGHAAIDSLLGSRYQKSLIVQKEKNDYINCSKECSDQYNKYVDCVPDEFVNCEDMYKELTECLSSDYQQFVKPAYTHR